MSVKYYQTNMHKSRTKQVVSCYDLYGLADLDDFCPANGNNPSNYSTAGRDEGFCEIFSMKMDRTLK